MRAAQARTSLLPSSSVTTTRSSPRTTPASRSGTMYAARGQPGHRCLSPVAPDPEPASQAGADRRLRQLRYLRRIVLRSAPRERACYLLLKDFPNSQCVRESDLDRFRPGSWSARPAPGNPPHDAQGAQTLDVPASRERPIDAAESSGAPERYATNQLAIAGGPGWLQATRATPSTHDSGPGLGASSATDHALRFPAPELARGGDPPCFSGRKPLPHPMRCG